MKILATIFLLSPTNTEQFQIKCIGGLFFCQFKYYACIKGIESLIELPIFVRNALTFAIILQFLTHKEMYDETKPAKLCTLLHRKPVQWLEIYLHCTVHCSNIPESSNEIYYVYDYTENGLDGLEG